MIAWSPIIYHNWTSTCWGNEVRNGRCTTCREPASTSPPIVYVSVPDVVDVDELLSLPNPPWHKAHARYTPRVKELVPVWKQRQVMKQQRPRDGLR